MNEVMESSLASMDHQLSTIEVCLDRLTEDDLWKTFKDNTNSIGNLCLHLAGSEYFFIVSLIGNHPITRERSKEFTDNKTLTGSQMLEQLRKVRLDSKEVLKKIDSSDLMKKVHIPAPPTFVPEEGEEQTVLNMVMHMVEHVALHTGQIIYMTKLLQEGNENVLKYTH